MKTTVKASITLSRNGWTNTFPLTAEVEILPTEGGRDVRIHSIPFPDLTPMPIEIIAECKQEICDTLRARALHVLSGQLSLHDILELAEIRNPEGDWRCCHFLGSVNALEEKYTGVLIATNGMVGITRCGDLAFRVHSMSKWTKKRSTVARPPKDEESPSAKQLREAKVDEILAGLLAL